MHVPLMTMAVSVRVSDEKDIVEGDVVTVTVKMTRLNLKEGETAGSIHAPLFPKDKHEEWWIFLIEKYTGGLSFGMWSFFCNLVPFWDIINDLAVRSIDTCIFRFIASP